MMTQLETGQVWKLHPESKDYGDIDRWQVVFVKGINAIVMNCATLEQKVIYGQGALDTFTFECLLMNEPPRLDKQTLKGKGF